MAIEYGIDVERRLLLLKGIDKVTVDDLLAYLRQVVIRPEVAGFNGLVDLTGVKEISLGMIDKMQLFSQLKSSLDSRWSASRLAIVDAGDGRFGLDGLYETFRGLKPNSAKQVSICKNMDDARNFLGLDGELLSDISCRSLNG